MRTAVGVPLAGLALLVGVAACSTSASPPTTSEPAPSAGDAATDAGPDGGRDSCVELANDAAERVREVASANQACTLDEDCEVAWIAGKCFDDCSYPVARSGTNAIDDAIAEVNRTTCAEFLAAGCTHLVPPCPGPGTPRCSAGRCDEQ